MALTELEETLIDALKFCNLKVGTVEYILILLQNEKQQWALANYLRPYLRREEAPTKEEIMAEVEKILGAS